MNDQIEKILQNIQNNLSLEGVKRVFEQGYELRTIDLNEPQDPEEFTRSFLIDKILFDLFNVHLIGRNRKFHGPKGERKVDYAIKYEKTKILIEAKPINANLFDKSPSGAVNQINGVFTLAIVQKDYKFGIATDGLKWVFINDKGKFDELDIRTDFEKIKRYIVGEERISQKKLEDISKKFYLEYNDLLHGVKRISKNDCLVNSIQNVDSEDDCEEIAQIIIDRLIFIKFIQSRGIIKEDVLNFLYELEEYELNHKLNQLFFEVMNTKERNRGSIDPHFSNIPYLNGSLFEKFDVEKRYPNYRIKAKILKYIIEFLNKFQFVHKESLEGQEDVVDPEILGYIFERAMTATDRKGSGAYYTPKEITKYIAENTIYPTIVDKANRILLKDKGYKKSELIKSIDELFILPATTLNEIWNKVILNLSICDNACGSGAFLLATASILFELNKRINEKLNLNNTDISLKKLILKNIYGVDINSRGIEIARLRLWLWLVESYKSDFIEPLPNIEYNLRTGNSLIGYVDIEQFGTTKITLDDFNGFEESPKFLFNKFRSLKNEYRKAVGDDARKLKVEIEEIREKIDKRLNIELYREIKTKHSDFDKDELLKLKVFHWGFEFYEDFNLDLPIEQRGFDIIVGNPPYVKEFTNRKIFHDVKKCSPSVKQYYEGKMDYLYFFIELGIDLLNKEGRISFITTNYWLQAKGAKSLREKILNETVIESIFNFNEYTVFEGTGQHNLIFFLKKKDTGKVTKNRIDVSIVQDKKMDKDELIGYFKGEKSRNIESFKSRSQNEYLTDKNHELTFLPKNIESICQKIKEQQNYKLTEKDVAQGIVAPQEFVIKSHLKKLPDLTIGEGIFTLTCEEIKKLNLNENEKGLLKPFFTSNQIDRYYSSDKNEKWIIYTDTKTIKNMQKYPNLKKHLDRFAEVITSDFGPYGLHRAREEKFFLGNKIFCYRKTKYPAFSYVDFPCYATQTYFIIKPDNINLKYLLGILNSKLIHFWLFYKGKREGNQLQIDKAPILSIPIKKVSDEQQKSLIDLVEKMIALNKDKSSEKKIQDIDEKINDYVYKIYGLTEEKKTIEDSLS